MSMILYCLHFISSLFYNKGEELELINYNNDYIFPLDHRVQGHLFAEVVILLGRSYNEYQYGRWGTVDIMHHSVFLYAVYLGLCYSPCIPYAWLICHMQALHFPLVIWYLGGKRKSYSNNSSIMFICHLLFPGFWFLAVSYRFTIMTASAIVSFLDSNYTTTIVLVMMGLVMIYLDYGWSKYFIGALKKDQQEKDSEIQSDAKNKSTIKNEKEFIHIITTFTVSVVSIVLYCVVGCLSAGIVVVSGYLQ